MDLWTLFNRSAELGIFIDSTNTFVTGSTFLTLLIIVGILLLIASMFKMPETLYLIPLLPLFIIFSIADPGMKLILAIASVFLGYVVYSILPWK